MFNIVDVFQVLNKNGVNLDDIQKIGKFVTKMGLSVKKFNAADRDTRRKILKTALRTILPFPVSLAAGEILVQLVKRFKPLRDAIENGVSR